MNDTPSAIATLRLFNRKVGEIESSRFWQTVSNGKAGLRLAPEYEGEETPVWYGVGQEDFEYFFNRWRMLVHSKEHISTRKLSGLYDTLPITIDLKTSYEEVHVALIEHLSKELINDFGTPRSLYEVIDVLLYGDILHVEQPKRLIWEEWSKRPALLMFNYFWTLGALRGTIAALFHIRALNQRAIEELESTS